MTSPANGLIVIPVFNEGSRLPSENYRAFLRGNTDARILFVDDGSTDNTGAILRGLAEHFPGQVLVESLRVNGGKAEAVRTGLLWAAANEYGMAVYLDADLAAPLETAALLLNDLTSDPSLHCIIGSRIKLLGWQVKRSELRHYLGRVFATAASITLGLPVYDTQCGAKGVRLGSAMQELLEQPFLSRWLFDVELIARIRDALGPAAMREVPLPVWIDAGGSSLRLVDWLRAPWQLLQIRRRHPPGRHP